MVDQPEAHANGFASDDWIEKRRWLIDPKKLHAIGWMVTQWSMCEVSLHAVLAEVVKVEFGVGWAVTHSLGDITISDTITDAARAAHLGESVVSDLSHLLKYYGICRMNRNALVHSMFGGSGDTPSLVRSPKGPRRIHHAIADSLDDIRRVADDIDRLRLYMPIVIAALRHPPADRFSSWPERLPLPALISTTLPPTPTKPKRRRRSSPGDDNAIVPPPPGHRPRPLSLAR